MYCMVCHTDRKHFRLMFSRKIYVKNFSKMRERMSNTRYMQKNLFEIWDIWKHLRLKRSTSIKIKMFNFYTLRAEQTIRLVQIWNEEETVFLPTLESGDLWYYRVWSSGRWEVGRELGRSKEQWDPEPHPPPPQGPTWPTCQSPLGGHRNQRHHSVAGGAQLHGPLHKVLCFYSQAKHAQKNCNINFWNKTSLSIIKQPFCILWYKKAFFKNVFNLFIFILYLYLYLYSFVQGEFIFILICSGESSTEGNKHFLLLGQEKGEKMFFVEICHQHLDIVWPQKKH